MDKHFVIIGWFVVLSLWTSATFAAPAPIITSTQARNSVQDHSFGIGFTSSVVQRPFIGVDDQNASLPYLSYKYGRFYIEGLDAGYNLIANKTMTLDLLGTPRFYEVQASFAKNGELDGIDKTRPSYFAGLSTQFQSSSAIYTVQLLRDLLESDGNELVLQISKPFQLGKSFTFTTSAGAVYQDKNLVDYFYSVQTNETRPGRPQYDGKGTLNYNVTLNTSWYASKHIEILAQFKYELLGSGITDSPIIDEDTLYHLTFGAVYRF